MTTRYCFRCGREIHGQAVYAFIRDGLQFTRVDGTVLCMDCGGNGANTLTPDERARLDRDQPALIYPDAASGWTSGHSGTDTSADRAARQDADGTTAKAQRYVLAAAHRGGYRGVTVAEVRQPEDPGAPGHHGMMSSALTALHAEGRLARLEDKRDKCHLYVLPEHVGDRITQAKSSNATMEARLRLLEARCEDAEAKVRRCRDLLAAWRQTDTETPYVTAHMYALADELEAALDG